MATLLSYELETFHVHVKSFAPRYRCQWPERVPGRLCVFLDGSMAENGDDYTAFDVVYKPPEDRPSLRFGERGARTLTVELRRSGIDVLRSGGFNVEEPFSVRSAPCYAVAERVRTELVDVYEMTPLVLEGLVLDLFTRTHRLKKPGGTPPWLEKVRERIEAHFARPWTLRDYARDAGVHPVHLAARFRTHFKCTVGEHIRALRMRRAMRELTGTTRPIADIALEAGFADQSHLTRAFKKHLGVTPGRLRLRPFQALANVQDATSSVRHYGRREPN